MSQFNDLSEAIGVAIHKAVKERDEKNFPNGLNTTMLITERVLNNSNVKHHIENLVEHTIKNSE